MKPGETPIRHGAASRQMSEIRNLETVWYEYSPYLYLAIGIAAIIYADTLLARLSCALLILAALTILRLRRTYRNNGQGKPARRK